MYVGTMPAAQERSSLEASLSDSEEESTEENSNEYVTVSLNEIRKEMQCPICLGIIRKTRTVMECLHRFCRECIDKAMRLGNNECPACRTHCASRRSLRDDPNFDSLIASIYPDVDKYEEEEMALLEEDTRRNKQIQANIAETFRRQSEALVRRRTTAKATAAAIVRKAHGKFRSVQGRTRGKGRGKGKWKDDFIYEDDEEYYMNREDEPSSAQETRRLPARKRQKPSTVETSYNDDQSGTDDNSEREEMHNDETDESGRSMKSVSRESNDASPVTAGNGEGMVTWARACARSHTRYGSLSGGNNKHIRCMRATVLLESLAATRRESEDDYDIHFTLKPMPDEGTKLPSLDRPNLCTSPNITIQHLSRFLASQFSSSTNSELEIVVEKILDPREFGIPTKSKGKSSTGKPECFKVIDVLDSTATLSNIYSAYWNRHDNLALFYRPKM